MSGILTQLAAATATRGTRRPTIPAAKAGLLAIILLNPRAVPTLAVVAATYATPSCSFVTPVEIVRAEGSVNYHAITLRTNFKRMRHAALPAEALRLV